MLYLTRKVGETVIINENIRITVVETRGKNIKLGFEFPSDVSVLRQELYEKIKNENQHALSLELDHFIGIQKNDSHS
jgi:carbon storage regulator